jgi:hypothetical protein
MKKTLIGSLLLSGCVLYPTEAPKIYPSSPIINNYALPDMGKRQKLSSDMVQVSLPDMKQLAFDMSKSQETDMSKQYSYGDMAHTNVPDSGNNSSYDGGACGTVSSCPGFPNNGCLNGHCVSSCGQLGGRFCSQGYACSYWGFNTVGISYDCLYCCN